MLSGILWSTLSAAAIGEAPELSGSSNNKNKLVYQQMHKYYDSSFPAQDESGRFVMLVMRQHYHARRGLGKPLQWMPDPPEFLTQDGRKVIVLDSGRGEFRISGTDEVLRRS